MPQPGENHYLSYILTEDHLGQQARLYGGDTGVGEGEGVQGAGWVPCQGEAQASQVRFLQLERMPLP